MFSSSQKSSGLFLPILIVVPAFLLQVSYTNTTSEADIQSRQTVSVPDFIKINGKMSAVKGRFLELPLERLLMAIESARCLSRQERALFSIRYSSATEQHLSCNRLHTYHKRSLFLSSV